MRFSITLQLLSLMIVVGCVSSVTAQTDSNERQVRTSRYRFVPSTPKSNNKQVEIQTPVAGAIIQTSAVVDDAPRLKFEEESPQESNFQQSFGGPLTQVMQATQAGVSQVEQVGYQAYQQPAF